jgi:hypothetical protein
VALVSRGGVGSILLPAWYAEEHKTDHCKKPLKDAIAPADTGVVSHRDDNHAVRKIVLPSGRSIEVIRFDENDAGVRDLHACPSCTCELVQPVSWAESSDSRWQLTLECPNCGWFETGVYERTQVERLEDKLDEGLSDMIADLQRLTQANMAADVDRFVAALQVDLILPEDF